jgi:polysaccharide pyruvyl transferase WcaK-like protein
MPVSPKQYLLLSPYSGDNLGDGAIQQAFIQNIWRRIPDAVIEGLTLHPAATAHIHDIKCRAVSAIKTSYYAAILERGSRDDATTTATERREPTIDEEGSAWTSLANLIKKTPVLGTLLRSSIRYLRQFVSVAKDVATECCRIRVDLATVRASHCLLVAGGGQLDDEWGGPWGHPYVLWKWSLLCSLTGTEFRLVGVGYSELHHRLSRWFVRQTLKRCTTSSFRDSRSSQLSRALFESNRYTIVPDMAFGYALPILPTQAVGEFYDIGISPIAYKSEHYWPDMDVAAYARFISSLAELLVHAHEQQKKVCLFITSTADRQSVVDVLEQSESLRPGISTMLSIRDTDSLDRLFSTLSRCRTVVVSRLHGIILSHLTALPVLAVNYDEKVKLHMTNMDQADYMIDFDQITGDSLVVLYEKMSANHDRIRRVLIQRRSEQVHCINAHFDEILSG